MRIKLLFFLIFIRTVGFSQTHSIELEDLNPVNFNTDFEHYDQKTAIFCIQLANMIYYNKGDIDFRINVLKNKYPFNNIQYEFISDRHEWAPKRLNEKRIFSDEQKRTKTESEVLFFGTSKFVIVAFRGSYSKKDWKTNFTRKIWKPRTIGERRRYRNLSIGHEGYCTSLMNLMANEQIMEKLKIFISQYTDDISSFPVYTTGHSLGGALATLFIKPLQFNDEFLFKGCYNFGPARAVSMDAINDYKDEAKLIHNIVNYIDVSTRFNYKKVSLIGNYYRFSKYMKNKCEDDDGFLYKERERLVRFNLGQFLTFYKTMLRYHQLDRYIERLKLPENSTRLVKDRGYDQSCFSRVYGKKK